jgi:hypothetical protein
MTPKKNEAKKKKKKKKKAKNKYNKNAANTPPNPPKPAPKCAHFSALSNGAKFSNSANLEPGLNPENLGQGRVDAPLVRRAAIGEIENTPWKFWGFLRVL